MNNRRATVCNFCECFAHAWAPTNRWGVVLVDADDAHLLMDYTWNLKKDHRVFYAHSNTFWRHNNASSKLHRAAFQTASDLDHKNHNGLDCRRENLREASRSQNIRNSRIYKKPKTSRFKGVYWDKELKQWSARIFAGKRFQLGYFDCEESAALAYNLAASERFGEFAMLNPL